MPDHFLDELKKRRDAETNPEIRAGWERFLKGYEARGSRPRKSEEDPNEVCRNLARKRAASKDALSLKKLSKN